MRTPSHGIATQSNQKGVCNLHNRRSTMAPVSLSSLTGWYRHTQVLSRTVDENVLPVIWLTLSWLSAGYQQEEDSTPVLSWFVCVLEPTTCIPYSVIGFFQPLLEDHHKQWPMSVLVLQFQGPSDQKLIAMQLILDTGILVNNLWLLGAALSTHMEYLHTNIFEEFFVLIILANISSLFPLSIHL